MDDRLGDSRECPHSPGRFPALILGDLRNTIANYNWIRDLADFVDAPLENFVNANYLPLPQDNDQVGGRRS
jgi:hypothetical protein